MNASERRPWHLNGRETAEWLGVSKQTVSDRAYPKIKSGRESLYDIREVLRIETLRNAAPVGDDGGQIDHEAEKARLTKARRVAQELENEEAQGRLRPVSEVEAAIFDALSPVAAGLDSLPMAIKRVCPELSGRGVELVEREIARMRNDLADDHITEPSESGAGNDAPGAVSADGGGVG